MSVFVIGPAEERALIEAEERARRKPITRAMIRKAVEGCPDGLDARPADWPEPEEVLLPLGWRVNMTVEQHEHETLLHLSISSPRSVEGKIPRVEAVAMVLGALGYPQLEDARDTILKHSLLSWLEDFTEGGLPAGQAVNLLARLRTQ